MRCGGYRCLWVRAGRCASRERPIGVADRRKMVRQGQVPSIVFRRERRHVCDGPAGLDQVLKKEVQHVTVLDGK